MPKRDMTVEQAVNAVREATREVRAAAANLERAIPNDAHQERMVNTCRFECDELDSAYDVIRDLADMKATSGKESLPITAGPQALPDRSPLLTGQPSAQAQS